MGHIYQQGLLLLFLLIITSECKVEIETFVTGYQGEDVAFHCFNSDEMQPKNCSRVQWLKIETQPRQPKVILVRPSTPRFQDAERVKWEADKNGKMSFHLTKLQRSDEGLYRCEIWQGWDCIHQTNISLKVKECKIWSVTTAANRPVELKCPVEGTTDQQGLKNVSWVMLKGGNPSPVDFTRAAINETSLVIRSMENRDSGWYRCQYVLKLNQRCFDINLLLQSKTLNRLKLFVITNSILYNFSDFTLLAQRDFSEEDNDATVPTTVGGIATTIFNIIKFN
ncbi:uncharacterized protein V6R79_020396 [Siganus canaliculatus]